MTLEDDKMEIDSGQLALETLANSSVFKKERHVDIPIGYSTLSSHVSAEQQALLTIYCNGVSISYYKRHVIKKVSILFVDTIYINEGKHDPDICNFHDAVTIISIIHRYVMSAVFNLFGTYHASTALTVSHPTIVEATKELFDCLSLTNSSNNHELPLKIIDYDDPGRPLRYNSKHLRRHWKNK